MISDILTALENGFGVMRSNAKMLFIGALVFIFPILFLWSSESAFRASYENINTTQKKNVAVIHDTLSELIALNVSKDVVQAVVENMVDESSELTKLRIIQTNNDGSFSIYASNILEDVNSQDKNFSPAALRGEAKNAPELFILEDPQGHRLWHSFMVTERNDTVFYTFTEHSFVVTDSIMSSRRQMSYLTLTAIFIFLIGLAYWVNKQTDWALKFVEVRNKLSDRDTLTNMIAHEFRTPLTAIKGYGSFLAESKTISEEELRFVKNINRSSERLVNLVNDFLEVARIQSGNLAIEISDVDITAVFDRVIENLMPIAKKKNLKLGYKEPSSKITIKTDENRVIQILTNIITNAIKYTDEGSVHLECENNVDNLIIRVKDTGAGISAEDQKKLFDPFVRVGKADESETVGTGLGMLITKQLVKALHGTIGVESIKGVGTHIVITFKRDLKAN